MTWPLFCAFIAGGAVFLPAGLMLGYRERARLAHTVQRLRDFILVRKSADSFIAALGSVSCGGCPECTKREVVQ